MKLNVGDLVELLYDGTTFSGVITAVTPERVEMAFTLNIFVEGAGKVTWPDGADLDVDVGANALTKLHLRLPLEDVARVLGTRSEAQPSRPRAPTRKARTKDLLDAAGEAALERPAAPEPASPLAGPAAPAPEPPSEPVRASGSPPPAEPEPDLELEDLLAGDLDLAPEAVASVPEEAAPKAREGMWVDHDAPADGMALASGELFPANLVLVSTTGCVARIALGLAAGDRVQLKFKLGKDSFDLAASVVAREAPETYEIAYDTLPSEVRVRMLRAVLGLAKPELRTQESWTYQLRQKGGA
ncbi:MAG: hypothetical protein FJZ01_06810 [Candidatus Sericytochromatia bacterium]|nr:hypothetical protein [Candidatus Tanganyikabacteria bacterium]